VKANGYAQKLADLTTQIPSEMLVSEVI